MSQSESFPVDLLDRDDVRDKLPRAQEIAVQKNERADAALRDAEQWRSFVLLLKERAELPADAGAEDEAEAEAPAARVEGSNGGGTVVDFTGVESVLDAVVRTVNEQNRPIRSKEVAELLRASGKFDGITNQTVSNALYYASERAEPKRIRKLERRGFYGPIDESLLPM